MIGIALYILIGRRTQAREAESQAVDVTGAMPPERIRWRLLLPFLIMTVATGTMVQSVSAYLALYAVDFIGVDEAAAAALMAVTPGVGLIAAPLGGYLSDRAGSIPILVAISFAAIPLIYVLGILQGIPLFVVVMVLIGFVTFTRMPISEAYIVGFIPERRRSTILGFYFFAGAEAAGLMTPVMGNLIDSHGFRYSFTILSLALAAITVVCAFFLWRNRVAARSSLEIG